MSVNIEDSAPESENTFPPVSDTSCRTVLDTVEADDTTASVSSIFNWKDNIWPGTATLASYADDGAERAFQRLRKALKKCKSYSGVSNGGEYDAEVEVGKAPDIGDEAIAFRTVIPLKLSGEAEEALGGREEIFVRTGTSIAVFSQVQSERKGNFPRQVIEEQIERLRKAQRS
ncbi:hypothetical protein SGFS_070220 [Streptomyces graminofaciens]|uniref:Uncharacterized protein n=2 Tax=Streptomyces graminofaciens TaxID=68212 RepID=A0ABM7FHU2_9ACTN|nr:hypothetical protein SGFS_070220 [Streptomyces graminofaciens]